MGHLSRSTEDRNFQSNVNYGGPIQEVLEGSNSSNLARDHCAIWQRM